MAETSACAYGCAGAASTSSGSPSSTMRPRYITATRWLSWRTARRSWLMKSMASRRRSCSSASRFITCAWMETSSALIGSSQTSRSGSVASARAITARWRWPPESSCG